MYMQNNNRKVVMLKGAKDKWYEQAFFVLKDGAIQGEMDCLKEAERIVNGNSFRNILADNFNYTPATIAHKKSEAPVQAPQTKKNKKLDNFLNMALLITGVAVVALITYHFM